MQCEEPTCGAGFEARREHARFCSDRCRLKWNRRNSRTPAEPTADTRAAARDLAVLAGARQAGKITHGEFAVAAVRLIARFGSVNDALIALGQLAWEGIERGQVAEGSREREDA